MVVVLLAEIYAVSIQKGGVGKTSLVTNLAGAITRHYKKKVLIIDTDSQGNASIAFGLNPNKIKPTVYDVMMGKCDVRDAIIEVSPDLHICPANDEMSFLEFDILPHLKEYREPFKLLTEGVKDITDDYDYIFIDTPPSLGLVTGNVLALADKVIIPFVPETFAVQGLVRVVMAVNDFKSKENSKLQVIGIVGMMIESRTVLHSEMLQQARRYCMENDIHMFETVIPKSIRFANSTAYDGKPATWTDYKNPIVSAYYELLKEMFER